LAGLEEVIAVVLFGSVARGEPMTKKSDIDLLVLVDKRGARIENQISKIVGGEGSRIVPSVNTPKEFTKNPYFAFEILRDGIVLYKRPGPLELPFALPARAVTLYKFDISGKTQSEKSKFNLVLYGRTDKRKVGGKTKNYCYVGIVERLGGQRVGRGSFFVPSKAETEVDEVFKFHGVPMKKIRMIEVAYE
jgi:hypothetical protein